MSIPLAYFCRPTAKAMESKSGLAIGTGDPDESLPFRRRLTPFEGNRQAHFGQVNPVPKN